MQIFESSIQNSIRQREVLAGLILAIAGLTTLIALSHHPTLHGKVTSEEAAEQIHALGAMARLVHGAIMALFVAQLIGFFYFCQRLGFDRPPVLSGFVAFALGVFISIIPMALDGFVTVDLVEACHERSDCGVVPIATTMLISVSIQVFTKISLVCLSVSTLFWSAMVVQIPGLRHRLAGVTGILCATIPLLVLAISPIRLQPNNLSIILLAQVIWTLAVAAVLAVPKSDEA